MKYIGLTRKNILIFILIACIRNPDLSRSQWY